MLRILYISIWQLCELDKLSEPAGPELNGLISERNSHFMKGLGQ